MARPHTFAAKKFLSYPRGVWEGKKAILFFPLSEVLGILPPKPSCVRTEDV